MAKITIIQETCDQCGKVASTFPVVIHLPDQEPKVYDLCSEDFDTLMLISGGEPFVKGKKAKRVDSDDHLQAQTEKKAVKRHQQWDEDELKFLRNNPLMPHADAATKLNRTFYGVRTRRHKMRMDGEIV